MWQPVALQLTFITRSARWNRSNAICCGDLSPCGAGGGRLLCAARRSRRHRRPPTPKPIPGPSELRVSSKTRSPAIFAAGRRAASSSGAPWRLEFRRRQGNDSCSAPERPRRPPARASASRARSPASRLESSRRDRATLLSFQRAEEALARERRTDVAAELRLRDTPRSCRCKSSLRAWPARRRKDRRRRRATPPGRLRRREPRRPLPASAMMMSFSGARSVASAAAPAGNLLKLRMNDTTSAVCSAVSVPGAVSGISILDLRKQIADGLIFPGAEEVLAGERRSDAADEFRVVARGARLGVQHLSAFRLLGSVNTVVGRVPCCATTVENDERRRRQAPCQK